jgi:hypothetical protein
MEGLCYLRMLASGKLLNMDMAVKYFGSRGEDFWNELIFIICKFDTLIGGIVVAHKEQMAT